MGSGYNYKQDSNVTDPNINSSNQISLHPARVRKAMLEGETYPEVFASLGEYQSIGGGLYSSLNNPNPEPSFQSDQFALPLFPNMSNIPLENEIIYVIKLPDTNYEEIIMKINLILNNTSFSKYKIFDYRIKNQLILQ